MLIGSLLLVPMLPSGFERSFSFFAEAAATGFAACAGAPRWPAGCCATA
jgi:hypothetical protein